MNLARSLVKSGISDQSKSSLSSFIDGKWDNLKQTAGGFLSALGTDAITNNSVFRSAGRGAGIARNPFLAASFEGVQFRIFNFQYKFYPKSRQESDNIENIIKILKYGMHPSYEEFGGLQNALFRYPNIYKPSFSKPEYLFDFGFCVIRDLAVVYHDQGTPKYIEDNGVKIPAFIGLNISLTEIEIITKDSLAGPNGSGTGRGK
jgi:hypothetical protein